MVYRLSKLRLDLVNVGQGRSDICIYIFTSRNVVNKLHWLSLSGRVNITIHPALVVELESPYHWHHRRILVGQWSRMLDEGIDDVWYLKGFGDVWAWLWVECLAGIVPVRVVFFRVWTERIFQTRSISCCPKLFDKIVVIHVCHTHVTKVFQVPNVVDTFIQQANIKHIVSTFEALGHIHDMTSSSICLESGRHGCDSYRFAIHSITLTVRKEVPISIDD